MNYSFDYDECISNAFALFLTAVIFKCWIYNLSSCRQLLLTQSSPKQNKKHKGKLDERYSQCFGSRFLPLPFSNTQTDLSGVWPLPLITALNHHFSFLFSVSLPACFLDSGRFLFTTSRIKCWNSNPFFTAIARSGHLPQMILSWYYYYTLCP